MSAVRRWRWRSVLSWLLIGAGLLALADVGATLLWQEPVTAVIATVKHSGIDRRYLNVSGLPLTAAQQTSLAKLTGAEERMAFLARREAQDAPAGAAIGRIRIASIGATFDVVQGTSTSDLELGPGHYRSTALPGLGRTVAIAGHRTTYLAPFRNLDSLHAGDRIVLKMPYGTFDYAVQYQRVVNPNAWWITRNVGYDRLVLSACTPLYSAAQRIVVFARLVSSSPSAGALKLKV